VCVTAPICPASTPDLVTAWMAVAKSGVIPRKATLEAPMLPANYGKRRRRTSRTRPAAPSSGSRHCRAAPASRRQSTDPSSVCWSSVRSRHRRPEGSCLASGDAAAMQIVPAPCLPVAGCTRPSTKFPCGAEHSSARSATQRSRSWHSESALAVRPNARRFESNNAPGARPLGDWLIHIVAIALVRRGGAPNVEAIVGSRRRAC